MKTEIQYYVCRGNLGDDTTDAQYAAFKKLVELQLAAAFPNEKITVGDSDFCNVSTVTIIERGAYEDGDMIITQDDVNEAASDINESWWDAE